MKLPERVLLGDLFKPGFNRDDYGRELWGEKDQTLYKWISQNNVRDRLNAFSKEKTKSRRSDLFDVAWVESP